MFGSRFLSSRHKKGIDLSKFVYSPELVRLAIEMGANMHANDGYALIWARYNGHTETVKLLEQAMED